MKIYLSVDMEGIWGITNGDMLSPDRKEYERGRRLMTDEANLVIDILFKQGVKEILVNDSHGTMENILVDELDERVSLISGSEKPLGMMEGIDETFDGAMFIGYHPRAITEKGIFDHTFSGKKIRKITIEGKELGEAGVNARMAGHYGVPVLLVAGDTTLAPLVESEIGPVRTVATKRTISRYCAEHLPKKSLRTLYQDNIEKALKTAIAPLTYQGEVKATICFKESVMTEGPLLVAGVRRVAADEIELTAKNYLELYKTIRAMIGLA